MMIKMTPPERIWVFPCAGCTMFAAEIEQVNTDTVEYIREDLYKELEAKLAKAVECIEEWQSSGCPYCPGDCSGANPPVSSCIMQMTRTILAELKGDRG